MRPESSVPARDLFAGFPADYRDELAVLAARYGLPVVRRVHLGANTYIDPRNLGDKAAEVCMVVPRPGGRLLIFRKTFYPPEVFRLLTGGIHPGEPIADALARELHEETGLAAGIRRFLAAVAYTVDAAADPVFHTFAFFLEEADGTPGAVDPREQVAEFREVEPRALPEIADYLDHLHPTPADELHSRWSDWGRFRAVIHRIVWETLAGETSRQRG